MPTPVTISRQAWKPSTVPAAAHAQPAEEAVGRDADAGRQRKPTAARCAGAERQHHDAERDQRHRRDLACAQGLADDQERPRPWSAPARDRAPADRPRSCRRRRRSGSAARSRRTCTEGGERQPLPALRRRPVDERQGGRGRAQADDADRHHGRACGRRPTSSARSTWHARSPTGSPGHKEPPQTSTPDWRSASAAVNVVRSRRAAPQTSVARRAAQRNQNEVRRRPSGLPARRVRLTAGRVFMRS